MTLLRQHGQNWKETVKWDEWNEMGWDDWNEMGWDCFQSRDDYWELFSDKE